MTERLSADVGDVIDIADDDLPVEPLGGEIRRSTEGLTNCPTDDEELQRALADAHAERPVDEWWADPVAAQQDWDAGHDHHEKLPLTAQALQAGRVDRPRLRLVWAVHVP